VTVTATARLLVGEVVVAEGTAVVVVAIVPAPVSNVMVSLPEVEL
jgi:hypothetical protein